MCVRRGRGLIVFATGQASPLDVGDSGRKCPDLWFSVAGHCSPPSPWQLTSRQKGRVREGL